VGLDSCTQTAVLRGCCRKYDLPALMPTTSSSEYRLKVIESALASRKEQAWAVQTAVPALGN
jgi:hypothetical protein